MTPAGRQAPKYTRATAMKPALWVRFSWKIPSRSNNVDPASPAIVQPRTTVDVAGAGHVYPDAVGRRRVLAHGQDPGPEVGVVQDKRQDGDEDEGEVNKQVLLKEHAAHGGDLRQEGDIDIGQAG